MYAIGLMACVCTTLFIGENDAVAFSGDKEIVLTLCQLPGTTNSGGVRAIANDCSLGAVSCIDNSCPLGTEESEAFSQ